MIRTCRCCGKAFHARHGNQRYCSDECREKFRQKSKNAWGREHYNGVKLRTKTCEACGEKFETKYSRQKYCSPECAAEASAEKNREYMRRYYREHKNSEKGVVREYKRGNTDPVAACKEKGLNCFECPYPDCVRG